MSTSNTSVGLYIGGKVPLSSSGNLDLYIYPSESGVGGIWDKTTLYINSELDPRYALPLFLKGETGSYTTSLNLFLDNHQPTANSGLQLYTTGPEYISGLDTVDTAYFLSIPSGILTLASGSILSIGEQHPNFMDLYIKADGTSDGYYYITSNMNLFMARDSEAVADRLTLYLAQNDNEDILSLYMNDGIGNATTVKPFSDDNSTVLSINNSLTAEASEIFGPMLPSKDVPIHVDSQSAYSVNFASNGQLSTDSIPWDKHGASLLVDTIERSWCFWYKKENFSLFSSSIRRFFVTNSRSTSYNGFVGLSVASGTYASYLTFRGATTHAVLSPEETGYQMYNDWHHYTIIVDSPNQKLKLYIDGNQIVNYNTGSTTYITSRLDDVDRYLLGETSMGSWIHDFRIYNSALRPEQVDIIKRGGDIAFTPIAHFLPNKSEHLPLYIHGSGTPPKSQIDLFTTGF